MSSRFADAVLLGLPTLFVATRLGMSWTAVPDKFLITGGTIVACLLVGIGLFYRPPTGPTI